jgi:hypothetical protein
MAKNSNAGVQVAGLILLVVGGGLLFWGYQMSGSLASQLTKSVSGAMPDEVMYRYLGGAVSAIVGVYLFFRR